MKLRGDEGPGRSEPAAASSDSPKARRLSPGDRETSIAAAAVTFFAERGFEGQTRELAATLGITQPLLYRYFPNKEALIERVYQEVFVGRWDPAWDEMISNRAVCLEDRLVSFYSGYAKVILTPEWVRLFMFSGLKGLDFTGRYLKMLRERVFERIIAEVREEFARPGLADRPVSDIEIEMIWALHASIFYLGVRQYIYGMPMTVPVDEIIEAKIRTFLHGIPAVLPVSVDT
jgi:AcrR family transcriptional regulator